MWFHLYRYYFYYIPKGISKLHFILFEAKLYSQKKSFLVIKISKDPMTTTRKLNQYSFMVFYVILL